MENLQFLLTKKLKQYYMYAAHPMYIWLRLKISVASWKKKKNEKHEIFLKFKV